MVSQEAKKRMENGTTWEIHAVATVVSKILPLYCPNIIEEGSLPIYLCSCHQAWFDHSRYPIYLVYACEFKCLYPSDIKAPVHYMNRFQKVRFVIHTKTKVSAEKDIHWIIIDVALIKSSVRDLSHHLI